MQPAKPELHLRALDLDRRIAMIEVSGIPKAPRANFFTFTDERDRHYVGVASRCQEPFPSGIRACEIEIPAGYEKHRLMRLELHKRALHDTPLEVPASEVKAAWEAAQVVRHKVIIPDGGVDAARPATKEPEVEDGEDEVEDEEQ